VGKNCHFPNIFPRDSCGIQVALGSVRKMKTGSFPVGGKIFRAMATACLLGGTVAQAQVTAPIITEWVTARSYARVYTTAANRTVGTSTTTWSGVTSPFYSDIQRVVYSNTSVYLYATGMPSYVAGNWLTPNGQQYNFWPINRAAIHRLPRTPSIPVTKQKTNGSGGVMLNGVSIWANGDAQSYDNTGSPNATTATIAGSGDGIWNRLAGQAEDFNFDPAKGHQPPNGAYHNHVNPLGLRYQLGDHVTYNSSSKTYAEGTGNPSAHSPLIGFANDGLPIYGPYGYTTATNPNSGVRRMISGFVKRNGQTTNLTTGLPNTNVSASGGATGRTTLPVWAASVQGRSATLASTEYGPRSDATYANGPVNVACTVGIFAEDYDYLGDLGYTQGTHFDLNRQNVRWCVTPEYPSGTYAYFVCINADGTTAFPDIINQEYFGTAPGNGQGTVTSISESVTEYLKGGQASPLTLSAAASGGGGVTLTWPSVEGATYTAAYSNNGTTFTNLSTTLIGTLGSTASYTTGTVAPHYKITMTALATYDTGGNGGVSGLNASATTTYAGSNQPPTISTMGGFDGVEDTALTIGNADLLAASNADDPEDAPLSFRVESVTSGTLTKGGVAVVPGTTLIGPGESVVWTPPANDAGVIEAFVVRAWDGSLASAGSVAVSVAVQGVNDAPTLTTFTTFSGAVEDTPYGLHMSNLENAGNEADIDSGGIVFRIEAVLNGTVTKNGEPITPGVTTVAEAESIVWTPAPNAFGTISGFTLVAFDGALASSPPVTAVFEVAGIPDGDIWDGSAGTGDWGTAANWTDNIVPDGNASFTGATPSAITLGGDRSVQNVFFSGTVPYTLSGNTLTIETDGGIFAADPTAGTVTHTVSSAVQLAGTAYVEAFANSQVVLSGGVSGSGSLGKLSPGKVTITGSNAFSGGVNVTDGTLQIGDGTGVASLASENFSVNGVLRYQLGGYGQVLNPNIYGPGSVTFADASDHSAVFTGTATQSGGTLIDGATLQIGDGTTAGIVTEPITLANDAVLSFNGPSEHWQGAAITGNGTIFHDATTGLRLNTTVEVSRLTVEGSGGVTVWSTCEIVEVFAGVAVPSKLSAIGSQAVIEAESVSIGVATSGTIALSSGATLTTSELHFGTTGADTRALTLTGSTTQATIYSAITGTLSGSISVTNFATLRTGELNNVPTTLSFGRLELTGTASHNAPLAVNFLGEVRVSGSAALTGPVTGSGILEKVGAGVLTLAAYHARTGHTSVAEGTLRLTAPVLATTSTVNVAGTGVMHLDFSGTQTVRRLRLGTVQQFAGTYGSLTSSAEYKTDALTGDGILLVTDPNLDFEDWAALKGLTGAAGFENGKLDDPENDGVNNFMEFVLDGDPLAPDADILPVPSVEGGYLTLVFARADWSEDYTNLAIQTTADFVTWTSYSIGGTSSTENGVIITIVENGAANDTVTVQIPIGSATKVLARLTADED
jgi:autotransporter-associated beta strand protein